MKLTPEAVDKIIADTHAGLSISSIARLVGCSERTVGRVRVKAGIAKPRVPALTVEQVAQAECLLNDGASYAEAARTVGCSPTALQDRFPGRGWDGAQRGRHVATLRYLGRVIA